MSFVGKYKLKTSENFDEYMKAVGVGMMTRKLANAATPVTEITVDGDTYTIKTSTTFKTTEIKFKLGEEFDETTGDGRQVKSTITQDGNILHHEQKGEKPSTITREFKDNQMIMILKVEEVTCTRVYDKQD